MTIFRLGYVAMSKHVSNASPSRMMTYQQFKQIEDREAAIAKLERIASTNLHNTLRLLKHNKANKISFYRLSSKLIPLATHEELAHWNYIKNVKEELQEIGHFAIQNNMRIDFHPDHYVVLNTPHKEKLKSSLHILRYHYRLLTSMGLNPAHRCVLHLGGAYQDKEASLERFIENWAYIPTPIQSMVLLENDDTLYTMEDCLYICEKLSIPFVFDLHHHHANHYHPNWLQHWERAIATWKNSPFPIKVHLSSPRSKHDFNSHADYVEDETFYSFMKQVNQSVPQVDCMIEAKQKDDALFQLVHDLQQREGIELVTPTEIKVL
ncbi:UV DNA damage repair endonuclease UvsE [Pontibacillus salicampi]|uniref:UV DNA damage repair endonuclease UvsE n=1 Tax=Pontibacillus salicampi TaxID=1449801 RepID=A0ABV6LR38_9BACI